MQIIDLETYSPLELSEVGTVTYATHPETEVLCVYLGGLDGAPGSVWTPGQPIPKVGPRLAAWNAPFDRTLYHHVLVARHGWPVVEEWDCLMARGYAVNLPGKLASAAQVVGAPDKDSAGHTLMLRLCKPASPTKSSTNPKRFHTAENLARLYAYCLQDGVSEEAMAPHCPPLSDTERIIRAVDTRINATGIHVDRDLLLAIEQVHASISGRVLGELQAITGLTSVTGPDLPRWLTSQGVAHADGRPLLGPNGFDKAAIRSLLEQDLPEDCRRVLLMRQELSKTSLAKVGAMLGARGADGRLRGLLQYYGAHQTGRWAGRGVQVQNFPRGVLGEDEDPEGIIRLVLAHDVDGLLALAAATKRSALDLLVSLLRPCLTAGPGLTLVDADWSNIEGRLVAWLAGEEWKLEAFRAYDAGTGPDLYKLAYAKSFGIPVESVTKQQRQVGKVQELALGYQGGPRAFEAMAAGYGVKLPVDEQVAAVNSWRKAHPRVVGMWKAYNTAAIAAVRTGRPIQTHRMVFAMRGPHLHMILPSGRPLVYRDAKLREGMYGPYVCHMAENGVTKKWEEADLYGGILTENAAQALGRDLLAGAMVAAERHGIPLILHAHDELCGEVPAALGEPALATLEALMRTNPPWAEGLPLATAGWTGRRFRK